MFQNKKDKWIAIGGGIYLFALADCFYYFSATIAFVGILLVFLAIIGIQRYLFDYDGNTEKKRKDTLSLMKYFLYLTSTSMLFTLGMKSNPPMGISQFIVSAVALASAIIFFAETCDNE